MITLELAAIGEVEGQGFVHVDRRELPAALLPRHRQQVGQELRRLTPAARRNDDVIELDGHHAPPRYGFFRRMSSQGDVKYSCGLKPTPASSTRGPMPCSVAGSKIPPNMTRSYLRFWIWCSIPSRFLRSRSPACCRNRSSMSG